jgi:hypothetical protein
MDTMAISTNSGKKLVTAAKAASIFGCSTRYIGRLGMSGELRRVVESPRVILYDLKEVERIARDKAEIRKRRGGRPRSNCLAN